jgi:DNA-binding NarL/FixJ family response regulator
VRFLIVDDHPVVRRGIRDALQAAFPGAEFAEAATAAEALRHISRRPCDAVLLDITLPGRSGLDVLREAKSIRPDLPIVVLTMHSEGELAVRALREGADAYLTKDTAEEELAQAVRRALAGGKYVGASLGERLARRLASGAEGPPHEALSSREYEILIKIADGKTVSQIADELALSVKTVSTYRSRVLSKMGMSTNAELIRYVIERRLAH